MTIPVVWLSLQPETPARGYWDQGLLEALFSHELWQPVGAHDFEHVTTLEGLEGAVVVFPARSQVDRARRYGESAGLTGRGLSRKLSWIADWERPGR